MDRIKEFIDNIDLQKKNIIQDYYQYYLKDKRNMSLVAKKHGISRERVRQILNEIYECIWDIAKNNIPSVMSRYNNNSFEAFIVKNALNSFYQNDTENLSCLICGFEIELNKICPICEKTLTCQKDNNLTPDGVPYKNFKKGNVFYSQFLINSKNPYVRVFTIPKDLKSKEAKSFINEFLMLPVSQLEKLSNSYCENEEVRETSFTLKGFDQISKYLIMRRRKINIKRTFLIYLNQANNRKDLSRLY